MLVTSNPGTDSPDYSDTYRLDAYQAASPSAQLGLSMFIVISVVSMVSQPLL